MNKDIIKIIAIVVIIAGLVVAGVFGGYQWSDADHAKRVTELQKIIYDLGIVIQTEENKTGEINRELKIANRGRIDAIKINNHNKGAVRRLQIKLNVAVKELENVRDHYNYIVMDVTNVNRVYNESRNECNGLPGSNDPALVSSQLSEFTGDSVTEVVRDLVGYYCSVATDYNNLYATCETLLAGKTGP